MIKTVNDIDEAFELVAKKLNQHGIVWWLEFGSMLGAVREGKRIEWDEDYDIGFWIKDCPRVFMALHELNEYGLVCNGNLHLGVANKNGEHYICISAHKVIKNRVYQITGVLGILEHVIGMPIRKIISPILKKKASGTGTSTNKNLLLILQLFVQWFQMRINYKMICKGSLEDYSTFIIKDMGGVPSPIPVGYNNVLKNLYNDYMTPKRNKSTCYSGGVNLSEWRKKNDK